MPPEVQGCGFLGRHLRGVGAAAAVGAVGTAAHYLLLVALVEAAGLAVVPASAAGFCLGATVNYLMNRTLVFRSARAHREALPRFMLVALTGLAWNALLMALLTGAAGLPYLVAQILTTGLLVFWHYMVNAAWTFRAAHRTR
jgi:putative flippase GtrA